MRILHADTDDLGNPLRGGQPVRTFEVNSRLAERHDITVFTSTYRGARRQLERGKVRYRRLGIRIPGWGLSPHLSFLARLGHAVRRTPHDLVIEEFTPPVGFCLLPRCTDKPVISIVQWFFFQDWERRYHLPLQRWMRSIPDRVPYRNVIVQTDRMGDYFRELLPQARIWTVPCGVSDEAFHADATADGDYALFLGRLDAGHKGLDLLLDTWERLAGSGLRIPLRIAGAGPAQPFIERRLQQSGLGDVVQLLGRVEGEQKNALLQGCRFLVMPSRQETFGISALEGMAASRPVVAFDIDHLNEVLSSRWAVLTKAFDTQAYAAAVASLWAEPARSRHLGQAAFAKACRHRWSEVARMQEQVYQDVIARQAVEGVNP